MKLTIFHGSTEDGQYNGSVADLECATPIEMQPKGLDDSAWSWSFDADNWNTEKMFECVEFFRSMALANGWEFEDTRMVKGTQ